MFTQPPDKPGKLTLYNVAFSLPALQPVATRLTSMRLAECRLQGRADGFLTLGWTALTCLCIAASRMEDHVLPAFNLPAVEDLDIQGFSHRGGVLQLNQLGCPQVSKLMFELDSSLVQANESSGRLGSLLHLRRLASLTIVHEPYQDLDMDLPASLTQLVVWGVDHCVDFFRVLLKGRELHQTRGAAALDDLRQDGGDPAGCAVGRPAWMSSTGGWGGQLSSLKELVVTSANDTLLGALGAMVSSAPNLACLRFSIREWLPSMEISLMSSASLERVTVHFESVPSDAVSPMTLILSFPARMHSAPGGVCEADGEASRGHRCQDPTAIVAALGASCLWMCMPARQKLRACLSQPSVLLCQPAE